MSQGASFQFRLTPKCKQCSCPPELLGSPGGQNVTSQGVQSVHFQTPSSSISLPPSQTFLRPLLADPAVTKSIVSFKETDAKWPPSFWQKSSALVQFIFSAIQWYQWSPCFSQNFLSSKIFFSHKISESQKAKTLRIARFLSQKLSG